MSDGRSLGWVFTVNNPTDQDSLESLIADAQYVIYGREVGEEGTPHLQGYCYFKTKKSLKQMKAYLPRAYLAVQKGTFEQAIDYCKKSDPDFKHWGTPPMSKKRKGECGSEFWDDVKKKAKAGDLDNIPSKVYVTHYATLKKIAADNAPTPDELDMPDGHHQWFYGETGTGKSRTARDKYPKPYLKACNKWWDKYLNQENVLIEDFDKRHEMLGHHLKIWADRYPFMAEVKGCSLEIRPFRIIVTSNWHPKEIWPTEPQTLDPILRRFKVTEFQGTMGVYPRNPVMSDYDKEYGVNRSKIN